MLTRLVVLFLLIATAVSVSTPAQASTLTVDVLNCESAGGGYFNCEAYVSGGTGTYTSYTWVVQRTVATFTYTTTVNSIRKSCTIGEIVSVDLTVTDSAGATASARKNVTCTRIIP